MQVKSILYITASLCLIFYGCNSDQQNQKKDSSIYRIDTNGYSKIKPIDQAKYIDSINIENKKKSRAKKIQNFLALHGPEENAYEYIKTLLKSPVSAQFSDYEHTKIRMINDTTWGVMGYVDAQNTFGGLMRADFVCAISYSPETGNIGGNQGQVIDRQ